MPLEKTAAVSLRIGLFESSNGERPNGRCGLSCRFLAPLCKADKSIGRGQGDAAVGGDRDTGPDGKDYRP